ncbi:thioesterase domain-containing protein [Thiomicrorhabdus sp.]|uniref:thioesterase domain-containing protein n=1 Tax=Thiomicrorhabdus sp. TaxID=2039724 RepID=UPI0029C7380F|nr:thioesterase domain-containing protein [Thiomicrorhabdus sp.]
MMLKALQNRLNQDIPLTKHMGIEIRSYDGETLSLQAPLDRNINHKQTAFGGSLYSISVLTGWSLIYLILQESGLEGHIVIQKTQTRFLLPVSTDLMTECRITDPQDKTRFLKTYRRKGLARLHLEVSIGADNGKTQLCFEGDYVVHKHPLPS